MARHTLGARTYVKLDGSAAPGWGLAFKVNGDGVHIYDVYWHKPAGGWSLFGGIFPFVNGYSGVVTLGGAEQIGRQFALGTIPRGNPLSELAISNRITIGQGDHLIEGGNTGDRWSGRGTGNDEIYGLGGWDTLYGGAGNDSIDGGAGDDRLYGDAGNDVLFGGDGRDSMTGGAGNDTYWVDRNTDVVTELAGGGRDIIYSNVTLNLLAQVEDMTLVGFSPYSAMGNGLSNRIEGNAGSNQLYGRDGNDTLLGGAGHDTLIGDAGNDSLDGGAGNNVLRGGAGIDTALYLGTAPVRVDLSVSGPQMTGRGQDQLFGIENIVSGSGNDTLTGDAGDNLLQGGAGNDLLSGNAGRDTLDGGAGADTMRGGAGNDVYLVNSQSDRVVEIAGGGIDRINATISIDLARSGGVYALVESVLLQGSAALSAQGDAANNLLTGNAGANLLSGRGGNDLLTGGAGADTFVFGKGFAQDRIADFQDGVDRIRLQGIPGVTDLGTARSHATQSGADVVFDFGNGDRLTVQGATISAVLDDLVFA